MASNSGVLVTQSGLDGDFTLTLAFDSFIAGSGSGFNASINTAGNGVGMVSVLASLIGASITPSGVGAMTSTQPVTNVTGGTITFERQGTAGTVTVTAGGQTATVSAEIEAGTARRGAGRRRSPRARGVHPPDQHQHDREHRNVPRGGVRV